MALSVRTVAPTTIGERIKSTRINLGLTQDDLARATGVSVSSVSRWEAGDGEHVTVGAGIILAKMLQVPFAWLVTGRGTKT